MINPLEYIPFARLLLDDNPTEIRIRTAINRAYYGVYLYTAGKYANSKGGDPYIKEKVKYHSELIKMLKEENDRMLNKIGAQLFDLKRDREDADYDVSRDITKPSAEKSYSQALRIKDNIDKAFSS